MRLLSFSVRETHALLKGAYQQATANSESACRFDGQLDVLTELQAFWRSDQLKTLRGLNLSYDLMLAQVILSEKRSLMRHLC